MIPVGPGSFCLKFDKHPHPNYSLFFFIFQLLGEASMTFGRGRWHLRIFHRGRTGSILRGVGGSFFNGRRTGCVERGVKGSMSVRAGISTERKGFGWCCQGGRSFLS